MTRATLPVLPVVLALSLAACGREEVNPPTDPAPPISVPDTAAPPATPAEVGASLPGSGPARFVGRWAAEPAWCANPSGAERPVEITPTRFEGYENSCAIDRIDERTGGYDLALTCTAEGMRSQERVRLEAQGDALRLTWPDRNGAVVLLTRCGAKDAADGAR